MSEYVYVVFEPYKDELIAVYKNEEFAKQVVEIANRNTGKNNCEIKYVKMKLNQDYILKQKGGYE